MSEVFIQVLFDFCEMFTEVFGYKIQDLKSLFVVHLSSYKNFVAYILPLHQTF